MKEKELDVIGIEIKYNSAFFFLSTIFEYFFLSFLLLNSGDDERNHAVAMHQEINKFVSLFFVFFSHSQHILYILQEPCALSPSLIQLSLFNNFFWNICFVTHHAVELLLPLLLMKTKILLTFLPY